VFLKKAGYSSTHLIQRVVAGSNFNLARTISSSQIRQQPYSRASIRRNALSIFCSCICLRRAVSCAICWACRASMRDRRPTFDWSSVTVPAASLLSLISCSISSLRDIRVCRKVSSWFCSIYFNLLAWLSKIYHGYPEPARRSRPFIKFPKNYLGTVDKELCLEKGLSGYRRYRCPTLIFNRGCHQRPLPHGV
jgi:hypothetical protein